MALWFVRGSDASLESAMAPWKLLAAPLLCAAFFGACGDGPDEVATGTATATTDPSGFGDPPVLGGNITQVYPEHGTSVPQASTAMAGQLSPRGICAEVNFQDLPQSGQWFRMAVDGVEVTDSPDVYWFVPSQEPEEGTICYAPEQGLEPGRHTAALSVQDPMNPAAQARQLIGWAFDVTP